MSICLRPLLCRHPEDEEDEEGEEDEEAPMALLLQRPIPPLQQELLPLPHHPEWQARQLRRQRHHRQVRLQSIPPPLPSLLPLSHPLTPTLTLTLGSGVKEAAPLRRASPLLLSLPQGPLPAAAMASAEIISAS